MFNLIRPRTAEDRDAERIYRAHVERIIGRVRALFEEWLATREFEPDNTRLANAAAVHRWESLRLLHEVEALAPPKSLLLIQRQLQESLLATARGCQLLANGYRSHKSEAVCDGQALLLDTVGALDRLAVEMDRR